MSDTITNPSDPEQDLPASPDANLRKESAGARLRSEREARSWTVEHVASQLNLAPRQVDALERDDYAALPGIAIVRGFIRAYAKLLKIDPALVIGLLPADSVQSVESLPARPTLATPFSRGTSLPSLNSGSSGSRRMLILAVLGVLVAGGFAALQLGWISSASLPFAMPGMPDRTSQAPSPAVDAAAVATPPTPEPAGLTPTQPVTPPSEPIGEGINAEPSTGTSQTDVAAVQNPAGAGKNELVLTMAEDSWVEVRPIGGERQSNGAVAFARLLKAGSSETIDVSEPIVLIVGNVNGVEASLRGAPFDLKAGAKNNVTRINVK